MKSIRRVRSRGGNAWLVAASASLIGCGAQPSEETRVSSALTALGDPLPGLDPTQSALFESGLDAFNEVETVADGLGPVFNERACGNCHDVGASGGSGIQFEVRAGRVTGSTFDPLASQGGQLFSYASRRYR